MKSDSNELISEFHKWMRENNILSHGSRVNYRKKLYQLFNKYESVEDMDPSELGQREKSVYNKYQEFLEDKE